MSIAELLVQRFKAEANEHGFPDARLFVVFITYEWERASAGEDSGDINDSRRHNARRGANLPEHKRVESLKVFCQMFPSCPAMQVGTGHIEYLDADEPWQARCVEVLAVSFGGGDPRVLPQCWTEARDSVACGLNRLYEKASPKLLQQCGLA